jgi:hypothetical protein
MCVDSHVSLELARRLKPWNVSTVFGGTHFSAIAEELASRFPWVDYVVGGEGEAPFERLLSTLKSGQRPPTRIIRAGRGALLSLDSPVEVSALEHPAYDLVDLDVYFALNPRRLVDVETGRGCRFKCSFCYSPGHYLAARDFDIPAALEELSYLGGLGAQRLALTDDNFLNFPDRAMEICAAIRSNRLSLRWQCYATFPQITEHLADRMALAGCDRIFCGIDAVGQNAQRALRKAFLPPAQRFEYRLEMLREHGIVPTCAFLLCPPSHPAGRDLEATIRAALTARLHGAKVRLNVLTLYNGTPAMEAYSGSLEWDEMKAQILLDVPSVVEQNPLARELPHLFPFHCRYAPRTEWHSFIELSHCLSSLLDTYPRTLDRLWDRGISPIDVGCRSLASVGDLCQVEKMVRREEEQAAAYSILEALVRRASEVDALQSEDPFERGTAGTGHAHTFAGGQV